MAQPNQNPEQKARDQIDERLIEAGWVVQNKKAIDFNAAQGIRETGYMISDDQLDYNHHLKFYFNLGLLTGNARNDRTYHQKAQYQHALCVCDAILGVHIDAVAVSEKFSNEEGLLHLRFGVSRRAKAIWVSLRNLLALVNPERSEPLLSDQVEEVARDLNVIYLYIRGALDNFAWCLRSLCAESTRKLPPIKVGLFVDEFLKDTSLSEVAQLMTAFTDWNKEIASRRDPAAHRIPLTVPPAIIDDETRGEYEKLSIEYGKASADAMKSVGVERDALEKFENAENIFERLQRIGKFVPVFVHHPNEGFINIYPTVPQDVGQLVRIARGLSKIIVEKTTK